VQWVPQFILPLLSLVLCISLLPLQGQRLLLSFDTNINAVTKLKEVRPLFDHLALAHEYRDAGDWSSALREYARLAQDDLYPGIYYEWGTAARAAQDYQTAKERFEIYIQRVPLTLTGRVALAQLMLETGDLEQARHWYSEAVALYPSEFMPQLGLGIVTLKLGDALGAEQWLRKALAVVPNSSDARYYLGMSLQAQGRDAEAWQAFEAAWQGSPASSYAASWYLLACRLGREDDLARVRDRLVAEWPETWEWVRRDCRSATEPGRE
jgi:tetratricopeptide (TPR) repeat protein